MMFYSWGFSLALMAVVLAAAGLWQWTRADDEWVPVEVTVERVDVYGVTRRRVTFMWTVEGVVYRDTEYLRSYQPIVTQEGAVLPAFYLATNPSRMVRRKPTRTTSLVLFGFAIAAAVGSYLTLQAEMMPPRRHRKA